jgi:hypothetical protein
MTHHSRRWYGPVLARLQSLMSTVTALAVVAKDGQLHWDFNETVTRLRDETSLLRVYTNKCMLEQTTSSAVEVSPARSSLAQWPQSYHAQEMPYDRWSFGRRSWMPPASW